MRLRAPAFSLALLLAAAIPAAAQDFDGLPPVRGREDLWRVDSLYVALDAQASLAAAAVILRADSLDEEASLRAARAALALGISGQHKAEQKEWYLTAESYAGRVLERDSSNVPALYWLAAARGRRTMLESKRSIVPLAKNVHELATRILTLDPTHPGAHNIIGKFTFELMILSGFERFIARHLLGGDELIDQATWAEAERNQRMSIAEAPYMVLFHYELARTLARQHEYVEARKEYDIAVDLPVRHPPDTLWKRLSARALQELTEEGH